MSLRNPPLRDRRPSGSRRAAAALAAAALALAAAACGGSGGGAPAAQAPQTEVEWVRQVMTDLYLYADRVDKDVDLSTAADAAQALERLRVNPPDRFSYVDRLDRYAAFFDEGRSIGLGVGLRTLPDAIVLRFVHPGSPADLAGLRRGDRIVAIDGRDVASLVAEGKASDALGPSVAGLSLRLAVERAGVRRDVTVVKAEYVVAPVLATRVIEHDGTKVGYVSLYTFSEPARAAWDEAIASIRAAGARTLVVDLRDNGGGRLYVAAAVAGSLAPPAATGQVFTELRHNARHAADDLSIAFPASDAAGAFDRVAWLVSDVTCSAAESLVAGLRPFRADASVGTATCGKPVGFEPQTRGDVVLSAVSFAGRNRDGLTDWFDGLQPTCTVADEPYLPYGDPADPRLAAALRWLSTGSCGTAAPKSATPAGTLPTARGLATETGAW
jgi:C-terminal processing protease CtpA/Prc